MKKPLFSVIIPVYKAETYLRDCVQSVQHQSFADFEIILVDDGSPDESPRICDELADGDCRIRVRHGENEGASSARKHGADMANGEYLFFLDADDRIASDTLAVLEKQVREFQPDIVCFGMKYEDSKGQAESKPLPYRYGFYARENIETEIFPLLIAKEDASYFAPSLCGKIIKKPLFLENALANRNCTIGEDGACAIPCVFHASSMVILEDCFYYYRYNAASATKGKKVVAWENPKIIYDHITQRMDVGVFDFEAQLYRKLVHDLFSAVLSQFNRKESYRAIVRDIKKQLKDPLYHDAIIKSSFSHSLAAWVMKTSLRYRLYFCIYLFSKL